MTLEESAAFEVCNRSVNEFTNYLRGLGADLSRRIYVFIDEIQYLDDPTHFLKLISGEHNRRMKLISCCNRMVTPFQSK